MGPVQCHVASLTTPRCSWLVSAHCTNGMAFAASRTELSSRWRDLLRTHNALTTDAASDELNAAELADNLDTPTPFFPSANLQFVLRDKAHAARGTEPQVLIDQNAISSTASPGSQGGCGGVCLVTDIIDTVRAKAAILRTGRCDHCWCSYLTMEQVEAVCRRWIADRDERSFQLALSLKIQWEFHMHQNDVFPLMSSGMQPMSLTSTLEQHNAMWFKLKEQGVQWLTIQWRSKHHGSVLTDSRPCTCKRNASLCVVHMAWPWLQPIPAGKKIFQIASTDFGKELKAKLHIVKACPHMSRPASLTHHSFQNSAAALSPKVINKISKSRR